MSLMTQRPDPGHGNAQSTALRHGDATVECEASSMEGNRARWRGQASNLVEGVSHSRVGSTPAAFRQNFPSLVHHEQGFFHWRVIPTEMVSQISSATHLA